VSDVYYWVEEDSWIRGGAVDAVTVTNPGPGEFYAMALLSSGKSVTIAVCGTRIAAANAGSRFLDRIQEDR